MTPLTFFKALADDTRLKSLLLIEREGELCVCELMAALGLSQPMISRHLARLRREGLVLGRRQGQWVFYRLHPDLPAWARKVVTEAGHANSGYLEVTERALRDMGDRPDRRNECCA
ncbi:metalloregulator ArsR/SmtB family transcription factor [Marinimicrobium locisalis]|uniref:metalloregulator ArsR/SmtB family transcription factor n=1 Tax=Marinimicrobium locisalis TaxID=546022 RepID=UPI003221B0EA